MLCAALLLAQSAVFAGARSGEAAATALHLEPRGAASLAAYDRLPYFKTGCAIRQVSSYDPDGGNDDGNAPYYYQHPTTGGYVVLEAGGAGTIYRIWVAQLAPLSGNLRMYFDGEDSPRLDISLARLFSGAEPPFVAPLAGSDRVSSGGNYCYYPFAFREGVRVEFTEVPGFYQVTYHLYNSPDGVATFRGDEDLSAVYQSWTSPGKDPKGDNCSHSVALGPFDLLPSQSLKVLDLEAAGSIQAVRLWLPQLVTTQYVGNVRSLTDDGRAHRGQSSFAATIEPDNGGVALVRRFDYASLDQSVAVYVDDALVGYWTNPGRDYAFRWREDTFHIPAAFTQGNASLLVRLVHVGVRDPWNEYYYWIHTVRSDGERVLTDELDIGSLSSERAHQYEIIGETSSGRASYSYPPIVETGLDTATLDLLRNVRLQMYWDNEAVPSVDVPIGFFFGLGASGEGRVDALMFGSDPVTHLLYNYFPMPFSHRAQVWLTNDSRTPVRQAEAQFCYDRESYPGLGVDAGYFTVLYNWAYPPVIGRDYVLAEVPSGKAHIVTTVLDISVYESQMVLHGDDRCFVDTLDYNPVLHGTGTADYFNAAGNFQSGTLFTLPTHGMPLNYAQDGGHMAMYRLHLGDVIPFERSLRMSFEHGSFNSIKAFYQSAVFMYLMRGVESLEPSDSLYVGDELHRQLHAYSVDDTGNVVELHSAVPGRDDNITHHLVGRSHRGVSEFTMAVTPANDGVRLARILHHGVGNQRADVYVDGVWALQWYTGGKNEFHRALYDFVELPADLTRGKSSLRIRIQFISSNSSWNEYYYFVAVHRYQHIAQDTPTPVPTPSLSATPSPTPSTTATPSATATPAPSMTRTETSAPTDMPTQTPSPTLVLHSIWLPVLLF